MKKLSASRSPASRSATAKPMKASSSPVTRQSVASPPGTSPSVAKLSSATNSLPAIDTEKLDQQLQELRLPTIRDQYSSTADHAAREHWTHSRFLAELTDQECQTRTQNRVARLLRKSHLLPGKTWNQFQWQRLPLQIVRQFETLRHGSFLDQQTNILVFGNPGSGKTNILCALGDELARQGRSVLFTTCQLLVQELLKAKRDLKLARAIRSLAKVEALIIDDLGYVQQTREEMEVLFTLLAERYERGSVLLSSNLPFSKWEQIFRDPMTAAAAVDRLIHHSVVIELNIPSFRLGAARENQKSKAESASSKSRSDN